jgi:pyruvate formate lyase activating enzyme
LSDLPILRDLVVKFLLSEILLDDEQCIGCEKCLAACPMDIYEMSASGDKATVKAGPIKDTAGGHAIDCIGCRRCEAVCTVGAIQIRPLEIGGVPEGP